MLRGIRGAGRRFAVQGREHRGLSRHGRGEPSAARLPQRHGLSRFARRGRTGPICCSPRRGSRRRRGHGRERRPDARDRHISPPHGAHHDERERGPEEDARGHRRGGRWNGGQRTQRRRASGRGLGGRAPTPRRRVIGPAQLREALRQPREPFGVRQLGASSLQEGARGRRRVRARRAEARRITAAHPNLPCSSARRMDASNWRRAAYSRAYAVCSGHPRASATSFIASSSIS